MYERTPTNNETRPEDARRMLVEQLKDNPESLLRLQQDRSETAAEWKEAGFDDIRAYVDEEGGLTMLARERQPENGSEREPSDDRYRIAFDQETYDVTIPQEVKGDSQSFRGSGAFDEVYNLRPTHLYGEYFERGEFDAIPPALPHTQEMEPLVEKFGTHLTMTKGGVGEGSRQSLSSERSIAYDLDEVMDEAYGAAHNEAAETETRALEASAAVRKKLFMTASKHRMLRDEAYRRSIESDSES